MFEIKNRVSYNPGSVFLNVLISGGYDDKYADLFKRIHIFQSHDERYILLICTDFMI